MTFILQEVDMAIADLTITAGRATAVDFTYPFWIEPSAVAVRVCLLHELFYLRN